MATTAPERSRALHNFSFPLRWGVQRLLRCSKVNPHNNDVVSAPPAAAAGLAMQSEASARVPCESLDSEQRKRRSDRSYDRSSPLRFRIGGSGGGGEAMKEESIQVVRGKLMLDLYNEMDRMKVRMPCNGDVEKDVGDPEAAAAAAAAAAVTPEKMRPWNLRTRRAACKEPSVNGGGGKGQNIEQPRCSSFSLLRTETKSPRLGNGVEDDAGGGGNRGEKRPRAKFSVALSRQQIEDDFTEFLGKRPPRKPNKRSRYVQRQMDRLFPGLWLSEITADMYRVNEIPEVVK